MTIDHPPTPTHDPPEPLSLSEDQYPPATLARQCQLEHQQRFHGTTALAMPAPPADPSSSTPRGGISLDPSAISPKGHAPISGLPPELPDSRPDDVQFLDHTQSMPCSFPDDDKYVSMRHPISTVTDNEQLLVSWSVVCPRRSVSHLRHASSPLHPHPPPSPWVTHPARP